MRSAHATLGFAIAALFVLACQAPGTDSGSDASFTRPNTPTRASVPTGRLPKSVRPVRYTLDLEVVPESGSFAGSAAIEIELDEATSIIWIHGLDLKIGSAVVEPAFEEPIPAVWTPADPSGVAALALPRRIGPGTATIRIDYEAAFDERLRGLYRVEDNGDWYAFTQFEPLKARLAFPSFDEPAFKTPFDVTLTVRADHVAIANTESIAEEELTDGRKRIRFATTQPLPTYLVFIGVGPFDVVSAPGLVSAVSGRAIPFRGVASRGRGSELGFALAHTPALLNALERYFASEYPYQKLDILSVPDFGSGAMENAGAITFRDSLLLLDEATAPEWQRRAFTYVMAHELAHQWFGNLVTMEWWDDLWLNEAFATWMGRRVVQTVAPEQQSDLSLLQNVHQAMSADSQLSARSIRQPIRDQHDIRNAFDGITYSKGAGVLNMFEHWLGDAGFRTGVNAYLRQHRLGNATQTDLIDALSRAAQRDVSLPFQSFLTQPGVPFLEIEAQCSEGGDRLEIAQSRYLPVGSEGSRAETWQVPMCVRYGSNGAPRESCQLIEQPVQTVAIEGGCPTWVMPNASAAGYYRWSLGPQGTSQLLDRGWSQLTAPERMSVAMNLEASFRAGTISAREFFPALTLLADDPDRQIAEAPMGILNVAWQNLVDPAERKHVETYASNLYWKKYLTLGWDPAPGDDGEKKLLRRSVIHFLAFTARNAAVRREAHRRARIHLGLDDAGANDRPLDSELIDTALGVAVQDGDDEEFEQLMERLQDERNAIERSRIIRALSATRDRTDTRKIRALATGPDLRINEVLVPLRIQSYDVENRAGNWKWIEANFDEVLERAGPGQALHVPWMASGFCTTERAEEVERFFDGRIDAIEGGPRNLAGTLESIRLCAALRQRHRAETRAFFIPLGSGP